jgi:transglutaminase-like putative cysteine protease
MDFAA